MHVCLLFMVICDVWGNKCRQILNSPNFLDDAFLLFLLLYKEIVKLPFHSMTIKCCRNVSCLQVSQWAAMVEIHVIRTWWWVKQHWTENKEVIPNKIWTCIPYYWGSVWHWRHLLTMKLRKPNNRSN